MRTQRDECYAKLGFCPQFDGLLDVLTGREHLLMYAQLKGIAADAQEALIEVYTNKRSALFQSNHRTSRSQINVIDRSFPFQQHRHFFIEKSILTRSPHSVRPCRVRPILLPYPSPSPSPSEPYPIPLIPLFVSAAWTPSTCARTPTSAPRITRAATNANCRSPWRLSARRVWCCWTVCACMWFVLVEVGSVGDESMR